MFAFQIGLGNLALVGLLVAVGAPVQRSGSAPSESGCGRQGRSGGGNGGFAGTGRSGRSECLDPDGGPGQTDQDRATHHP